MSEFNDTSDDYVTDEAGNPYDIIVAYDAGGGYEWDVYAIVRKRGTNEFYYLSDSGCSCNYFNEMSYSNEYLKRIEHYGQAVKMAMEEGADAEFASICNNARLKFNT